MNISRVALRTIDEAISSEIFTMRIAPILEYLPLNHVHKNIIRVKQESARGCREVTSWPYKMVLNLTNNCNFRCKFCEITYFHRKYPEHFDNDIGIDTFMKFHPLLRNLYSLEFFGNVGEPLTNQDFLKIIEQARSNYGTRLFLNTNGSLITPEIAAGLIANKFDDILVSVHAGTEDTYRTLIGGGFNQVIENIKILTHLKAQEKSGKPEVGIAFALNTINAADSEEIVDLVQGTNADYLQVSHYYDARNTLGKDISFTREACSGNAMLKCIYNYAKLKRVDVLPQKPPYLHTTPQQHGKARCCDASWSTIKFDGCIEHRNSHYVSVCNRIYLFRIDYTEFDFSRFHELWNHPYLQYMRETVNSIESNPICQFCKNQDVSELRNMDNEEYRKRRDEAVRKFFEMANDYSIFEEVPGVYVLSDNPYS